MGGLIDVVLVDACMRDGSGGSPTAVVTGHDPLDDGDLVRIPALTGISHVAVLGAPPAPGHSRPVRFFTVDGELPGCGHGTVAVIAVLTSGLGSGLGRAGFEGRLRAGGRDFNVSGMGDRSSEIIEAWFDQGLVDLRPTDAGRAGPFLAALGLGIADLHPDDEPTVASPGRPRLLLPVADADVLAALTPDQERLAVESRRHGQLGCFAYTPPSPSRRPAARMFAPAIGVPEDVANANSTGCLAAHLLATGRDPVVSVDQGDALGRPSTVHAAAVRTSQGITTRVGGTARIVHTSRLTLT